MFNWRFVFPFEYLQAEERIIKMQDNSFGTSGEVKIPPKLELSVWDADLVSSDDFIGKTRDHALSIQF